MSRKFYFKTSTTDNKAREGTITTPRGQIRTPAFMPVGTAATVKGMLPENVVKTGADILLGNTYHLMLRPGSRLVSKLGGLHKFMNWGKPILTDSGGFQVMSLTKLRQLSEDGVRFKSHIDGSEHYLTPERSIEIQLELNSDIIMSFDECTPYPCSLVTAKKSMDLSMRWAERSKQSFGEHEGKALFGIVQGSTFQDLRKESAEKLLDIGFDGYAIGGLAVGEGQEKMLEVLDYLPGLLPRRLPRYLMGVGKPSDLVEAVRRGIDMFDCVLPTRSGRTGQALTRMGAINIRNARHSKDPRPLDFDCKCYTCSHYSRAYLHHVNKAKEIISAMLLTWHNLHYYQFLMEEMRNAIKLERFESFYIDFYNIYNAGDYEPM